MDRRSLFLLGLLAAAGLLVCALARQWRAAAAADWSTARAQAQRVAHDLQRLRQAGAASEELGQTGESDPLARARRALSAAALPADALRGSMPQGTVPSADGRVAVRRVGLRFRALSPAAYAAWFSAWQDDPGPWRVLEVQWTHNEGDGVDHNRFDAIVTLGAPYLTDGSQP